MTHLALRDFAGSEGTAYEVATEGESVKLVLESATELPSSPRPEGGFRLSFRGPAEPLLSQGIYPFCAAGLDCEIFVVPIASDADGTTYEAIFN
jgi:hypothetical protein